jgi:hypothetical protein
VQYRVAAERGVTGATAAVDLGDLLASAATPGASCPRASKPELVKFLSHAV